MTLHRFFLPPACISSGHVVFPSDVSRQIERVLRLREGQQVIVLDNTGTEYVTCLSTVGSTTTGTVVEQRVNNAEPATHLTLYIGVLKAAKLELVVQKGTEIGVSRFVPITTTRTIAGEPGENRRRRWETIAREAAEQCGRGRIPSICEPLPYEQALVDATERGAAVLLWEEEKAIHLHTLQRPKSDSVALIVGPEGGLTEHEVDRARDAGIPIATLGSRVLRAETAALVGVTLLLRSAGDLG